MSTPNLAEQVAQKIKSLPSDKQQEVLKSIEHIVAEATRVAPQKFSGAPWTMATASKESEAARPDVWRFTTATRPTTLPE